MIKRNKRHLPTALSVRPWAARCAVLPLGIALSSVAFAADPVAAQPDGAQNHPNAEKKHKPKKKHARHTEQEANGMVTLAETKVTSTVPVKNPRLLSPVPQTGITREEFEPRNNRRLGDVIQRLPGVLVDGPTGSNQDVRLRGLDKEFTRVQVDGVQLPNGGEKREFQVNQLPSFMVGQVNVIRNPTADFESDGLAGRVDIKTREIPTEPKLEARFGYGGRDDMNGDLINGQLGFGFKPVDWFGGMGAFDHLDNIFERNKDKLISNGKREVENETERNHTTNLIADLGLFYDGGEFHAKPLFLNLDKDKVKTKLNTEPKKAASLEQENEDTNQNTSGVTLNHRHAFNAGVWESIAGYYSSTEDKDKAKFALKESKVGSGLFNPDKTTLEAENKEDQTWNYSTSLRVPFTLGLKQELKFGGAFRHRDRFRDKQAQETDSKGKSKDTTKPKDAYALAENYFAGFVQDTFWLTDRFSLLPGVRIEHVALESETGDGTQADKSVTDINPSFHALYRLRDDLSLRAAFSKSVNRPKFDELSPFEQDDGNKITIGNPDLNPARSWNFDIGGEYATADLLLGINLFHKEITGVIEEVDTGITRGSKHVFLVENVGNGWTRGIELEQRLNFGFTGISGLEGLQLWANETLLESQLQEADGNKRRFKQQPDFMANLGLDYTYAPLGTTVTAAVNYIAERRELKATGDVTSIDPSVTVDLSARQRVYKGLSVFGEIGNVTDEHRVESENLINGTTSRKVETYGRTFMAGLNLQF